MVKNIITFSLGLMWIFYFVVIQEQVNHNFYRYLI